MEGVHSPNRSLLREEVVGFLMARGRSSVMGGGGEGAEEDGQSQQQSRRRTSYLESAVGWGAGYPVMWEGPLPKRVESWRSG